MVSRAEVCYLVSPVAKFAEVLTLSSEAGLASCSSMDHLVLVRHPSLSFGVLAGGNQTAKFIAPRLAWSDEDGR